MINSNDNFMRERVERERGKRKKEEKKRKASNDTKKRKKKFHDFFFLPPLPPPPLLAPTTTTIILLLVPPPPLFVKPLPSNDLTGARGGPSPEVDPGPDERDRDRTVAPRVCAVVEVIALEPGMPVRDNNSPRLVLAGDGAPGTGGRRAGTSDVDEVAAEAQHPLADGVPRVGRRARHHHVSDPEFPSPDGQGLGEDDVAAGRERREHRGADALGAICFFDFSRG